MGSDTRSKYEGYRSGGRQAMWRGEMYLYDVIRVGGGCPRGGGKGRVRRDECGTSNMKGRMRNYKTTRGTCVIFERAAYGGRTAHGGRTAVA